MAPVGFRKLRLADDERPDWDGTGPRPLATSAWYPAQAGTPVHPWDVGPPRAPFYRMGEVAPDAPLAKAPDRFPVVLVSHGTGGSAEGIGWLGIRLAAAGYVVVGVDHPGNCAGAPYRAEGFLAWWERSRDLAAALDGLTLLPPFEGRLDLGRVFAAGFSLGGHTVLASAGATIDFDRFLAFARETNLRGPREFPQLAGRIEPLLAESPAFRRSWDRRALSYRDPRVRAVLALAPAPTARGFTDASLAAIDLPVAIMVGDVDGEAPAETCALWLHERIPTSQLTLRRGGVGHYVFICEGLSAGRGFEPEVFADPPGIDRRAIHDEAAALGLVLFGRTGGIPV